MFNVWQLSLQKAWAVQAAASNITAFFWTEVKIEKPIDQVPAEEVVEEIADQNQAEKQIDEPQEQVGHQLALKKYVLYLKCAGHL